MQVYSWDGMLVWQVPPCSQGPELQALYTSRQFLPIKFSGHWQEKSFIKSVQVPPLKQGLDSHSFMLISQRKPVKHKVKIKTHYN